MELNQGKGWGGGEEYGVEEKFPLVQPLNKKQKQAKENKKALGVSVAEAKYNFPMEAYGVQICRVIHAFKSPQCRVHSSKGIEGWGIEWPHQISNLYYIRISNPKGTMAKT